MVVKLVVLRQGFAKINYRGGGVGKGEGYARGRVCSPPISPLFIGARERGAGPLQMDLEGVGQAGWLAPQAKGGAPFRVSPKP